MKTTKELLDGLMVLLEVPEADYSVWRLRPSQLSQGFFYNVFSAYHHLLCEAPDSVDDGTSCGVARIVCGHIWEHRYYELYPDLTPQVPLTYQTPDFTISGTCDFIHANLELGEVTVIDTKCITDKVFNMFRYEPDESHHYVKQVCYYIEMLRPTVPKGVDISGSLALLSRHFLNVNPDNHYNFNGFTTEQWKAELVMCTTLARMVRLLIDAKNKQDVLLEKFDKALNAVVFGKEFLEPYAAYTPWGKRLFYWKQGKPTELKQTNVIKYKAALIDAINTKEAKYDLG
jgi:hypothetical protein